MTDEDGRTFHIRLKGPQICTSKAKFIIPTIGICRMWDPDDNPEHTETINLRPGRICYVLGLAWWGWQFTFTFAEWSDDRTDEEVIADWNKVSRTPKKVEDSQL